MTGAATARPRSYFTRKFVAARLDKALAVASYVPTGSLRPSLSLYTALPVVSVVAVAFRMDPSAVVSGR
jgi:hypothetical protein